MNFFPDFAPNSRKQWRVSLFQSNLRKQIRNLPKLNSEFCEKYSLLIKYYSKLFTGVLTAGTDPVDADSLLSGGNYSASMMWQHDPGKQDALNVTRHTRRARLWTKITRSKQAQQKPSQTTVILIDITTSVPNIMMDSVPYQVINIRTDRHFDAKFNAEPTFTLAERLLPPSSCWPWFSFLRAEFMRHLKYVIHSWLFQFYPFCD